MKKVFLGILSFILMVCGCTKKSSKTYDMYGAFDEETIKEEIRDANIENLSDEKLQSYLESKIYSGLLKEFQKSDEYFVENVSATYVSQEYLEELEYNSQSNIFFGYTLAELQEQFAGKKYVFTLGDSGETVVKEFESYDDTFEKTLKNLAIGTGVILICVTVSVATAGTAPAVSVIFAASAKTATTMAISGGALGGLGATIVEGVKTGDVKKALKKGALAGSEGFKAGAITGAITGGVGKAAKLYGESRKTVFSINEYAKMQRESGYPCDILKSFTSKEQYEAARQIGLKPATINGKTALIRADINLDLKDEFGRTNLERMKKGLAALDADGKPFELHHLKQQMDSTLAILTKSEHVMGDNNKLWHIFKEVSEIDRPEFRKIKREFWKSMAKLLAEGGV